MLRETDNCPTLDPSCHYQVPTLFLLTFVSQPLPPILPFPLGFPSGPLLSLFQTLGPTLLWWLYNQFPFASTFPFVLSSGLLPLYSASPCSLAQKPP